MNHTLIKKVSLLTLLLCLTTTMFSQIFAQHQHFSEQDTLRGSITPERVWWDLTYYHLDIKVDPEKQTINGTNTIQYRVLTAENTMQIDLQEPMNISKVEQAGKSLDFSRNGNVFLIKVGNNQQVGAVKEITIHYGGNPIIAANPPWRSRCILFGRNYRRRCF